MKTCTACSGSGYYDDNGSPPCGACDGTCSVADPCASCGEPFTEMSPAMDVNEQGQAICVDCAPIRGPMSVLDPKFIDALKPKDGVR